MTESEETPDGRLSPEAAFAVLGDETRIAILRTLGEADGPLSFTELHDRVGLGDSGQFNYHLDRVTDHFVRRREDGYVLSRAGRRVVEAVLSGALTDDPTLDPTVVDSPCDFCGAPIELRWAGGSLELYCTECEGRYAARKGSDGHSHTANEGYLGRLPFPPAGLRNRSPAEALAAGRTWANLEMLSMAAGLCPRCSATLESTIIVCEDHEAEEGICTACGDRHAAGIHYDCSNCVFDGGGAFVIALLTNTDLFAFRTAHGRNPVTTTSIQQRTHGRDYEEAIHSVEPFEATFTFHVDEDTLSLEVEGTSVVDVYRPSDTS